jgi:TonB-dependent receptor
VTSFEGDGGNPLLKPMEGNQFDAAAEWYFAPQGSLYTTLFYKELKNYFIRGTEPQSLFGRDDWQVTTTVNGDKGLVKGFEVGYSQFYDSLPGFLKGLGMQANFTYVDSSGGSPTPGPSGGAATVPPGLPLEGLSKKSYNLVGLYQRGPVEARLAYNWRERWLLTTTDGDGKGSVWNDDYGQLDASIFVRFGDHLQVGLEGNNLTNTTQKLLVGPFKYTTAWDSNTPAYNVNYTDSRLYQNAWFTFDRRFALTARVTF